MQRCRNCKHLPASEECHHGEDQHDNQGHIPRREADDRRNLKRLALNADRLREGIERAATSAWAGLSCSRLRLLPTASVYVASSSLRSCSPRRGRATTS